MSAQRAIATAEEFLAHAIAIEKEAAARYLELGDQMRAHHNGACAALFDWLAKHEQKHASRLRKRAAGRTLPKIPPWEYRWPHVEAPESAPFDEVHYLMTPYHLLQIALNSEQRAKAFFEGVASAATNPELRSLAGEFAAEEQQHIELIADLLEREPVPNPDWAHDFDPPVEPE